MKMINNTQKKCILDLIMAKMFKLYLFLIFSFLSLGASASDTLYVKIENHNLKRTDTINFDCSYQYGKSAKSIITLNVVIENLEKTKQWKFRYPLINGYVSPSIVIGNEIPEGKYAITFLLQNDFLSIKGTIKDYSQKSKGVNYILLTKNKDSYVGILTPEVAGYFTTPKMIFEDTARIVFSEMGRKFQNLYIDLKTNLDSTYTPITTMTDFISVGNLKNDIDTSKKNNYQFDLNNNNNQYTLKEVTVKAALKKKVERFDEEFSTGLFKFGTKTIFDGIDDPQLGNSMNIFNFLQGRVAGLQIKTDAIGNYKIKWREGNVDLFLDEFKVDTEMASYVNTNDIAMIKVFPPFSGGPTANGSIAIYTKRGAYYSENSGRKYNFQVMGYTPEITTWK
jgi:hypothetical protein